MDLNHQHPPVGETSARSGTTSPRGSQATRRMVSARSLDAKDIEAGLTAIGGNQFVGAKKKRRHNTEHVVFVLWKALPHANRLVDNFFPQPLPPSVAGVPRLEPLETFEDEASWLVHLPHPVCRVSTPPRAR